MYPDTHCPMFGLDVILEDVLGDSHVRTVITIGFNSMVAIKKSEFRSPRSSGIRTRGCTRFGLDVILVDVPETRIGSAATSGFSDTPKDGAYQVW